MPAGFIRVIVVVGGNGVWYASVMFPAFLCAGELGVDVIAKDFDCTAQES